jgi:chorismate-pyruvate lyase
MKSPTERFFEASRTIPSGNPAAVTSTPDLPTLYRLFRADARPPDHEVIPPAAVPEPYHRLLVHHHHMTVTVEEYFGSRVNVRVMDRRHAGDSYARKILLELQSDGRVVQFGVVRIRLDFCSEPVRAAILEEKTPLGRILIEHDVLRRIEPKAYFRVTPGELLTKWFGLPDPRVTYGRLGIIHCDGQPAIEVLEILAPIDPG